MKKLAFAAALAAGTMISAPAMASVAVNVTVEGGGTPIIYQDGSTYYAVMGLDTRGADGDNIANQAGTTVDLDYVKGLVANGQAGRISNVYFDANMDGLFGPDTTYTIGDESRFYNAFLLEFTGTGNIVFSKAFGGGTTTLGINVNNITPGMPPLAGAVPEPSAWALLILGFGAAGVAMRRRKAAVRVAYA